MNLYYIGRNLEEWNEGGTKWSMEGIFDSFKEAITQASNEEFIVEIEMNKKLPLSHLPENYWWKIDSKIVDKYGEEIEINS